MKPIFDLKEAVSSIRNNLMGYCHLESDATLTNNTKIAQLESAILEMEHAISENKERDKLPQGSVDSLQNFRSWPALDNNNSPYSAFRFAQHMAAAPRAHDIPKNGVVGGQFITLGYTDADDEIVDHAMRSMGVTPVKHSKKGSKETKDVSPNSPVAKIKRNKYGI